MLEKLFLVPAGRSRIKQRCSYYNVLSSEVEKKGSFSTPKLTILITRRHKGSKKEARESKKMVSWLYSDH